MANNPYTAQSISGYNANPPPDDDTTGSNNQVEWQKTLDKVGDPIKTLSEGIDTAALSMGTKVLNTDAGEANTFGGTIGYTTSELTISGGSITPTATNHTVDTEADAASDDLVTLATGSVNDRAVVALRTENAARVVTVKNASGNINLANNTDVVLNAEVPLVLQRNSTNWEEISRPTQDLESTATPTFAAINLGDEDLTTYDEGTFTPVFQGGTTPGSNTYGNQIGLYTRIGRIVTADFDCEMTAIDGAMAGDVQIGGLPFTSVTVANGGAGSAAAIYNYSGFGFTSGYTQMGGAVVPNTDYVLFSENGSTSAALVIDTAALTATARVRGTVSYQI